MMENLGRVDAQTYLYRLGHSKTEQAGIGNSPHAEKPIAGVAAEALTVWLEASGVTSGAIFRRMRGARAGEPLSAQAVALIVKRRAELGGAGGRFRGTLAAVGVCDRGGQARGAAGGDDGAHRAPQRADSHAILSEWSGAELRGRAVA